MLDPALPVTHQIQATKVIRLMQDGYDGVWQDNFKLSFFNQCDPLGGHINEFWNRAQGRRYTLEEMLESLQNLQKAIRRQVEEELGRQPYLAANSLKQDYWRGGTKLVRTEEFPYGLDAFDIEDAYLHVKPGHRVDGVPVCEFEPLTKEKWFDSLQQLQHAAK